MRGIRLVYIGACFAFPPALLLFEFSGVEGREGSWNSVRSSSSKIPSSKLCGGRDFFRRRLRSRWIGGLGGSSARRAATAAELPPDTVGRRGRWACDEYEYPALDSRPVVDDTGTENTDAVGERGNGEGRGGTGGGVSIGM